MLTTIILIILLLLLLLSSSSSLSLLHHLCLWLIWGPYQFSHFILTFYLPYQIMTHLLFLKNPFASSQTHLAQPSEADCGGREYIMPFELPIEKWSKVLPGYSKFQQWGAENMVPKAVVIWHLLGWDFSAPPSHSSEWHPESQRVYHACLVELVFLTTLCADMCHLLTYPIFPFLIHSSVCSRIHVSPTITFSMLCDRLGLEWRDTMTF